MRMSVFQKTVTLAIGQTKHLHTSIATRCSVEILQGRDQVRMQRVRFGALGDPFLDTNYLFLTAAQCIPIGFINATPNQSSAVTITFKVRTGRDFTGVPEFVNP